MIIGVNYTSYYYNGLAFVAEVAVIAAGVYNDDDGDGDDDYGGNSRSKRSSCFCLSLY